MTIDNYNYQSITESHKQLQKIAIGDEVLIRVHPKRFPLGTLKRLHNARVYTRFWGGLVPTPTSSIFPVIMELTRCSASRTWLVITLPRGHSDFQFVHCSHHCWRDSPLRSLCSPSRIEFIIHAVAIRQWQIFWRRGELMRIT